MKKLLFIFTLGFLCSCTGCNKNEKEPVQNDSIIIVDKIINDDFEEICNEYGKDNFRFYESNILLNNFLDEEYNGISELVNIYQVTTEDSNSFDTKVYKIQHFSDGKVLKDSIDGLWIEDCVIDPNEIKVSYDSAFILINKVNLPRPHSKHVTLRKPLGPLMCNTQWIFGNIKSQIWVDAVDGTIRTSNPAFPETFKMPLGEWP